MADLEKMTEGDNMPDNQLDMLSTPVVVPGNKLDADQYAAEDLDGVTESVFGSGNMNFLSLQSGQTDDALKASANDWLESSEFNLATAPLPETEGTLLPEGASADISAYAGGAGGGTDTARQVDASGDANAAEINAGEGNFSNATVGSVGASAFASNTGSFGAVNSNTETAEAVNGQDGNDGKDGVDGVDGGTGGPPDDDPGPTDHDVEAALDVSGSLASVGDVISGVEDTLLDVIDMVTSADVALDALLDSLQVGDLLDPANLTQAITDIQDALMSGLDLTALTAPLDIGLIEELGLKEVAEGLTDTIAMFDQVTGGLQETVTALTQNIAALDTISPELFTAIEDLSVLTDTLATAADGVVDGVTGVLDSTGLLGAIDPVLEGVAPELTGAVEGVFDTADSVLGQLESIVPELDTSTLPMEDLINPVEDIVGDIDLGLGGALSLLDNSAIDNDAGDSDITGIHDLDILDTDVLGNTLDIELDPLENIVGDIDLDLGGAMDVFGAQADSLFDAINGGTGNGDAGGAVGDVLSGLAPGMMPGSGGEAQDTDISLLSDTGITHMATEAMLDPVEDIVGDIDLGLGGALNLLDGSGTDNSAGDSDISGVQDLDILDTGILENAVNIELDPVEQIVGDIDLDLSSAMDVLGGQADPLFDAMDGGTGQDNLGTGVNDVLSDVVGGALPGLDGSDGQDADLSLLTDTGIADTSTGLVLDPVEEIVGDVDISLDVGADILGQSGEETGNDAGDTDLGIDIAGIDVLGGVGDIPLDPIEEIAGDIDIDMNIDQALDLLNVDDAGGNDAIDDFIDGIAAWTESDVGDIGGMFDDIVGGGMDEGDMLPDPSATIAEGLGVLDSVMDSNLGSLGGLFG